MLNFSVFKPQILQAFQNKLSAKIPPQMKFKSSAGFGRWELLEQMNSYTSIPQMFFKLAESMKDAPLLWYWSGDNFQPLTWAQVENQVLELASGLKNLGVKKGDRVIITGENRPEWCISDLAVNSIGAVSVPAYVTNTVHDHAYLMQDSGARVVIASNKKLADNIIKAFEQEQLLGQLIVMDEADSVKSTGAV
ncbi:MAG: AMP-binding protein, partial [Alphaproteobacteria bacterium]|nr:AMP-binding protein [Alphaproteobacteria bacterium]